MVNVLVTCGSPMTSLFLPTVLNWELQEILQKLNQATLKVRLSMNLKKTKVMYNEFAEDVEEPTTIHSRSLHLPRSMHLHGFRFEGTWDQTSYHPRMASFRLSECSLQKHILIFLKRQVYDKCILSTVAYGFETWNLMKQQTLKLRTMQRSHKRIRLNITWRDRKTANRSEKKNQSTRYHGNDK